MICGLMAISISSCEDFLDISPDSGISEEELFTKIGNVELYFNAVYPAIANGHPMYMSLWNHKWTLEQATEAAEPGCIRPSQSIRNGKWEGVISALISDEGLRPVFSKAFVAVRICNNVIANVERIQDANSVKDIYDLKAQAYFVRGYAYLSLCRLWGGMPYIKDIIEADDEYDRERLSPKDTYLAIAEDMDSAYVYFQKANVMRRDPSNPSDAGHLNASYKLNLPTGCAALALKSRALLYAASPLSSDMLPEDEQKELWKKAAQASWDAIQLAEDCGYTLLPMSEWMNNTYNKQYTNEQLWIFSTGQILYNRALLDTHLLSVIQNNNLYSSGVCPTQNFVDRYELAPVVDGPNTHGAVSIRTEEERKEAENKGWYNPQDPYKGLDARFYKTIAYNNCDIGYSTMTHPHSLKGKFNVWYKDTKNGRILSEHIYESGHNSWCTTGYYAIRFIGYTNRNDNTRKYYSDPLFLLSELYLNYAEAANECGGYNYTVPGAKYSSYQALMKIRERAGQGEPVEGSTNDINSFRECIKNERCIELAFIGHYYFDSYRWKDAPKYRTKTLYGMQVERTDAYDEEAGKFVSDENPTFKYTRVPLEENKQASYWDDKMYYAPFTLEMYYQFKNFDTSLNPYW